MRYVRSLRDISKKDVRSVGGKAANLGEMLSAKLPVPKGFAITADAYSEFIDASGLERQIRQVERSNAEDIKKLTARVSKLQSLFERQKVPDEISKEILAAYRKLKRKNVAVRSSALGEDTELASFAGQHSTFLNVKGEKQLLRAVKLVWASLFNAHAIHYRISKGLGRHAGKIGVVVQEMVDSKKSGVMFTINPVTKDRGELVIEAALGLGEAVVGGGIIPDLYVVYKKTLTIKEKVVNFQNWALYRGKSKLVKRKLSRNVGGAQTLSNSEILAVARLGKKVESFYKQPQDIEWAMDDKIYLLQSRPVTTIKK